MYVFIGFIRRIHENHDLFNSINFSAYALNLDTSKFHAPSSPIRQSNNLPPFPSKRESTDLAKMYVGLYFTLLWLFRS